jgi:hypothetical protein
MSFDALGIQMNVSLRQTLTPALKTVVSAHRVRAGHAA